MEATLLLANAAEIIHEQNIVAAHIDGSGNLVFTSAGGVESNAGKIKPAGIASAVIQTNGKIKFTFTDDTTIEVAGSVVPGSWTADLNADKFQGITFGTQWPRSLRTLRIGKHLHFNASIGSTGPAPPPQVTGNANTVYIVMPFPAVGTPVFMGTIGNTLIRGQMSGVNLVLQSFTGGAFGSAIPSTPGLSINGMFEIND